MTTYADLVAQRTELARQQAGLEKQLAEMQKAERQGAIQKIETLMAEHGLSVEDLGTAKAAPGTKAQKETRKVAAKSPRGLLPLPANTSATRVM